MNRVENPLTMTKGYRIGVRTMFFTNRKLIKKISVGIVGVLILTMVVGAVASYL